MSLLFNMLLRLVLAFIPRSNRLLISWLQSPSAVILEPKKIKSVTVSIVSPSIWHGVMEPVAMNLVFWMLNFKSAFSLSSFNFIKRLFSSSSLSVIRVVSSAYLKLLIFFPTMLNFCVAILILKMKEKKKHFQHTMLYYFKKGKNTTKMQKKRFVQCMEKVLWVVKHVKSGFQSFMLEITCWMMLYGWVDQLKVVLMVV